MDNKQRITTNTSAISANNELIRNLPKFVKPEGMYVWKKYAIAEQTLPEGYTQLHSIRSSGTQCIKTKFYPKYNSRVVMSISNLSRADTGFVFGTRDSASATAANQFSLYKKDYETIRSDYFGSNASATVYDTLAQTVIDKNKNITTAYGITMTNTAVSSGECPYPLIIFGLNNSGTAATFASLESNFCQGYHGDVLTFDFVPCMTASGEIGMYDRVANEFYGNEGTGVFEGKIQREQIGFATSDNPNKYPDGGVKDGYWYELSDAVNAESFGASQIACGSFLLSSMTNEITIEHGLRNNPKYLAVFAREKTNTPDSTMYIMSIIFDFWQNATPTTILGGGIGSQSNSVIGIALKSGSSKITHESGKTSISTTTGTYTSAGGSTSYSYFKNGITYDWIAWA